MVKNENTSISSVYDETTCIGKIMKGIVKVYERWKNLITGGVPPLTLTRCKGVDLIDYKIEGNSIQKADNSNIWDGTYTEGTYYDSNGNITTSTRIAMSNMMKLEYSIYDVTAVAENSVGDYSYNVRYNFFDENKNWLSQTLVIVAGSGRTVVEQEIQVPTGAKYINFSILTIEMYAGQKICPSPKNVPTQETPIEIESVGETLLPNEYQSVEYIESTGTQHIDTGLKSSQINKVYMNFEFTSITVDYNLIFGSQQAKSGEEVRNHFNIIPNRLTFSNGKGTINSFFIDKTFNTNTKYYLTGTFGTNGSVNLNGEVTECKGDGIYSDLNAYIFCYNYKGNANLKSKIKLYELKTWDMEGNLSRHYIPCYRKSDNVIGLYDLVNNVFYTNKGSGIFLKGKNTNACKIPVRVRGKNFYANNETYTKTRENDYTVNIDINKSVVNINGVSNRDYGFYLTKTKDILPAGTYTVSVKNLNYADRLYVADENGNIINNYIETNAPKQFTIEKPLVIAIYGVFAKGSTYNNTDIEIQIEKGTVANDYEPYVEPITTNIYLNEPLRKIGNYTEYIKFLDKNESRIIEEDIYDGTERWQIVGIEGELSSYYVLSKGVYGSLVAGAGLSTHFKRMSITSSNYNIGFNIINSSGYNEARICIRPDITKYSTLNLWKEFLAKQYENGTPVKVYHVLATPTTETIDLPTIPTFKGTTILEANTKIQPSNMEVVYKGKE